MGQFGEFIADLNGQFARRDEHQRPRMAVAMILVKPFKNWDREGGGFARTRAGLAHHIDAFESAGNQSGLNRRRLFIARGVERRMHRLGQVEVVKARPIRGGRIFNGPISGGHGVESLRGQRVLPEGWETAFKGRR